MADEPVPVPPTVEDAINVPDNNPDGVNPGKTDVFNATTNPDGTNQGIKKVKS